MSRIIRKLIEDIEENVIIDGNSAVVDTSVVIDGHVVNPDPYSDRDATHGSISDDREYKDHEGDEYPIDDGTSGGSGGNPIEKYEYDAKNPLTHDLPVVVRRKVTEVITDFSAEKLQEYQDANGIAYVVFKDDTRQQIPWAEVREIPKTPQQTVTVNLGQIASATNQNFWTDTFGAHVTSDLKKSWLEEYDEPNHGTLSTPTLQNPWHNILLNSYGILLRRGLLNLAGLSKDSISFYDGNGNDEDNITAVFGSNGAQIGKNTENHLVLTNEGLSAYDSNGNLIPIEASNIKALEGEFENLDAHYAHITDGVIDNATIGQANVQNLDGNIAKFNNLTAIVLDAVDASIDNLTADEIAATDIVALRAAITRLEAGSASVQDLSAVQAYISRLSAARITTEYLKATYAEIDLANVNNAWIENGVIKNAAITNEQVLSVSANKLTAGEINADEIKVRNLRAENLKVGRLNGQPIIGGYSVVSTSVTNYSSKNPTNEGWYEYVNGSYVLSSDTSVRSGVTYYTQADSVELYDQATINDMLDDINDRIDSQIETWTGTTVPLTSNYPANQWTTNDLKNEHIGDIYYVINAGNDYDGYTYRFAYDNTSSQYKWILIKDNQVTAALSRLGTAEGKIQGLESFKSSTTSWISETDDGLVTIRENHTTLSGVVDKTIIESVQLWFTKSNTTAPSKPKSVVTTNNASTGNAWNLAVPTYNSSYPNYYYCYQWKYADGTYGWSAVTRDIAMGESQQQARKGVSDAAAAQTTADNNIKLSVQLWFTKANETAPTAPTSVVTTNNASTGNAWNLAVPTYNKNYPYYFYCYQYQKGDDTYSWSPVIYDRATSENQKNSRDAIANLETFKTTTFQDYKNTVDELSNTYTTVSEDVQTALDSSIEYIVGTQTAATNVWTGITRDTSLRTGKTIAYKLPYAGTSSAATLNLTYSDGTTSGAKNVTINTNNSADVNVTTHFGAGSVIQMTYDGTKWRISMFNTNDNTYNRVRYESAITAVAAITAAHLIAGNNSGYKQLAASLQFDLGYPILYARSAIAASATGTNNDIIASNINYSTTGTIQSGTAKKIIYLKGTVSGSVFTIASSNWLTTVIPTSEDNFFYIPLGVMSSATNGSFSSTSQLWAYMAEKDASGNVTGGSFQQSSAKIVTTSNTVNSVRQTATTNSATISNLTQTLATNADGTTASEDIVHKVSAVEQSLDGFKSTVSNTTSSLVNAMISDGQTVVVSGSEFDPYQWTISAPSGASYTKEDYGTLGVKVSFNAVSGYEMLYSPAIPVTIGKTYILVVNYTVGKSYEITSGHTGYGLGVYSAVPTNKYDESNSDFLAKAIFSTNAESNVQQAACTFVATTSSIYLSLNGEHIKDGQTGLSFTIDNIQFAAIDADIGGRNYVKDSNSEKHVTRSSSNVYCPYNVTDIFRELDDSIGEFVISFDAKAVNPSSDFAVDCYIRTDGSGTSSVKSKFNFNIDVTNTEYKRFSKVIHRTLDASNSEIYFVYIRVWAGSGTLYTKNVKLEIGNKPTDWTPAPEDMATGAELTTEINQRKAAYATSSTAAATAAKEAVCSNFALYTGARVSVMFSTANTATTPTLNVNGTGAKTIRSYTGATLSEAEYKWVANSTLLFVYDGTYWRLQDAGSVKRLYSAETKIDQNAEAITLRATKTEATSLSQPNLAPFLSVDFSNVYNATTNPDGYWYSIGTANITPLEDGWAHFTRENTGTSAVYSAYKVTAAKTPIDLKPSWKYTFLLEIKNFSKSTTTSSWIGLSTKNATQTDPFVESVTQTITGDGNYYKTCTTEADITGKVLFTYGEVQVPASTTLTFDFRVSLYECTPVYSDDNVTISSWVNYSGPYKPYVGAVMYSTQAELKVANDAISSKVSSTDYTGAKVASLINQSAESVKIQANHVEIDGTAIFSNSDFSTALDEALDDIQIGGRNLLQYEYVTLYDNSSNNTLDKSRYSIDGSVNYSRTAVFNLGFYLTRSSIETIGTKYTVHFDITETSSTKIITYIYLYSDVGKILGTTAGSADVYIDGTLVGHDNANVACDLTDGSTRHIDIYYERVGSSTSSYLGLILQPAKSLAKAYSITVSNLKWESGTRPTDWTPAPEDIDSSINDAYNAFNGYTILWNHSDFSTANNGEAYLCKYDTLTGTASNADGWVMFNGVKRTITKQMANPNSVIPFNIPVYLVCRLSSASATSGTNYMVFYNDGWKYTIMPTPSAVEESAWTWTAGTDMILGKWVQTGAETAQNECEIFNPPLTNNNVTTNTITAASANALATTANTTANAAAPKTSAVAETQRIYYRSKVAGTVTSPGSTWITLTTDKYNDTVTVGASGWSTKITPIASSVSGTRYIYLYTAIQKKTVSGTVTTGTITLDDTTTVIDGGKIATGTITANSINAMDINASNLLTVGALNADFAASIDNANVTVGGRNLLLKTGTAHTSGASANDNVYVASWSRSEYFASLNLTTSTIMTYSLDYEVTGNSATDAYIQLQLYGNNITYTIVVSSNANRDTASVMYVNEAPSGHFVVTFKPTAAMISNHESGTSANTNRVRLRYATDGAVLKVSNIKLELGNKATDWTPAPEDDTDYVDSSISTVKTNLISTAIWYATSSTAADTAAKVATITPTTTDFTLTAGATVNVKFTVTNTADVANLTLSVNSTTAKAIKYIANGGYANLPAANYIRANQILKLVYDGTYWVTDLSYNSDTQNRVRWQNVIVVATDCAVTAGHIICGTASGYQNIAKSVQFDLSYPLLYAGTTLESAATGDNNYLSINSIKVTNNGSVTGAASYATVFLKGSVSGNTFTILNGTFLSAAPTASDSYVYIPLGTFYNSTTNIYFRSSKDLYAWVDGKFRQVTPTEIVSTQKIYYRCNVSSTTPDTAITKPTTWVTETGEKRATNLTTAANWSLRPTSIAANLNDGTAKYLYLYTCEQRKRLDGTISYTTVVIDDSQLVMDGGRLIANSITATQIASNAITSDKIAANTITIGDISTDAQSTILNTNVIGAMNGTCSTDAATQTKVVTSSSFKLTTGATITVKFSTANTYADGAVQLNVNSTGAKNIYVANAVTSTSNKLLWGTSANITFRYDGTGFVVIGEPRSWYGKCSTAAATAAKTDTTAVTGCVICKGTIVNLAMSYANTATSSVTLNIRSTGAIALYAGNSSTIPTSSNGLSWQAGYTQAFLFDGSVWRTVDSSAAAAANNALSAANTAASTASSAVTAASNAQTAATDAAKTATNYISANSSGIIIANSNPSTATTYQQLTATSTDFVVRGKNILSLGADKAGFDTSNYVGAIRVGATSDTNIVLNYYSIAFNIYDIGEIFSIKDLRSGFNSDGSRVPAIVSEVFDIFYNNPTTVTCHAVRASSYSIVVRKKKAGSSSYTTISSSNYTVTDTTTGFTVTFTSAQSGSTGYVLEVIYRTYDTNAIAMTFGVPGSLYTSYRSPYSISLGYNTEAINSYAIALGAYSVSAGAYSFSTGYYAKSMGEASFSAGYHASASGDYSVAIGRGVSATAPHSVAIGYNIDIGVDYPNCVILGYGGVAKTNLIFAVGDGAGSNAIAIITNGTTASTYLNGTYTANGTAVTSDARIKKFISEIDSDDAIDFIMQLVPKHYYKEDVEDFGFYAQDVEEIEGWGDVLVTKDNSGNYDLPDFRLLNYEGMIAPIVAALQGLIEDDDNIYNKHKKLKKKYKKLKKKYKKLNKRLKKIEELLLHTTTYAPAEDDFFIIDSDDDCKPV